MCHPTTEPDRGRPGPAGLQPAAAPGAGSCRASQPDLVTGPDFGPGPGQAGQDQAGGALRPEAGVGATVLLAEDDDLVRSLVLRVLARRGYRVIEAESGVRGAALLAEHAGPIDLLLTDLVMPGGVSGFDLAALVRAARPGTRVLFMSGYVDALAGGSDLIDDSNFIAKPFSPDALALKVRELLGR